MKRPAFYAVEQAMADPHSGRISYHTFCEYDDKKTAISEADALGQARVVECREIYASPSLVEARIKVPAQ